MTEHRDADTVIRDAVTATDTVTLVTVEEAAVMASVSVRTIRRWIQHGHLPHVEDENGKRVSSADLPMARESAGRGHGRGYKAPGHGYDRGHDNMATDTDAAMTVDTLSSVTAQMEAIRDQWLRPLVDRIEELSREKGRLEAERDQVAQERDALRAELSAAKATQTMPQEHVGAAERDDQPMRASGVLRDRLRRLIGRS